MTDSEQKALDRAEHARLAKAQEDANKLAKAEAAEAEKKSKEAHEGRARYEKVLAVDARLGYQQADKAKVAPESTIAWGRGPARLTAAEVEAVAVKVEAQRVIVGELGAKVYWGGQASPQDFEGIMDALKSIRERLYEISRNGAA